MNKRDAAKIADYVTYYQLDKMFDSARNDITDWKQVSSVNKNMTKGASWNILWQGFEVMCSNNMRKSAIKNMIWEFGDYLPEDAQLNENGTKKTRAETGPYHEEPVF